MLKTREAGNTEVSWCKAVPGGTGITVLALLFSKKPNLPLLQNALSYLQSNHPILNSTLLFDPLSTSSYSYAIHPSPYIQIHQFDPNTLNLTPPHTLHSILEHELNQNPWRSSADGAHLFFASVYALDTNCWVLTLRLHTSVCDRAAAVAILTELLGLIRQGNEITVDGNRIVDEVNLGIEDCIPNGQGKKAFWARGFDMLGYSLNSLRLANLNFQDTASPRMSRVVRLQLNALDTARLLSVESQQQVFLVLVV